MKRKRITDIRVPSTMEELLKVAACLTDLDALMDKQQVGQWLGLSRREIGKLIQFKRGKPRRLPVVDPNARVLKFHPRMVLAKFAADSGVAPEVIAAAFGARMDLRPDTGRVGILTKPAEAEPKLIAATSG